MTYICRVITQCARVICRTNWCVYTHLPRSSQFSKNGGTCILHLGRNFILNLLFKNRQMAPMFSPLSTTPLVVLFRSISFGISWVSVLPLGNGVLSKPPLKLGHGLVITSWMLLLIHALASTDVIITYTSVISVCKRPRETNCPARSLGTVFSGLSITSI